jgi:hypothetical protein
VASTVAATTHYAAVVDSVRTLCFSNLMQGKTLLLLLLLLHI